MNPDELFTESMKHYEIKLQEEAKKRVEEQRIFHMKMDKVVATAMKRMSEAASQGKFSIEIDVDTLAEANHIRDVFKDFKLWETYDYGKGRCVSISWDKRQ